MYFLLKVEMSENSKDIHPSKLRAFVERFLKKSSKSLRKLYATFMVPIRSQVVHSEVK